MEESKLVKGGCGHTDREMTDSALGIVWIASIGFLAGIVSMFV